MDGGVLICGKVSWILGELGGVGCCVCLSSGEDDGVYSSCVSEECSD